MFSQVCCHLFYFYWVDWSGKVQDPRKCTCIFFVRCVLKETYSESCGSRVSGCKINEYFSK